MKIERRYWDSDCFLSWLNNESGKADLCGDVLVEASEGKILIVTSALTITEVLKLKGKNKIPVDQEKKVIDFFRSEYIVIRNVTRYIAECARNYVWYNGINPKDAIHVATAIDARLTIFNTFDAALISKSNTIGDPPLLIEKPGVFQRKLHLDRS